MHLKELWGVFSVIFHFLRYSYSLKLGLAKTQYLCHGAVTGRIVNPLLSPQMASGTEDGVWWATQNEYRKVNCNAHRGYFTLLSFQVDIPVQVLAMSHPRSRIIHSKAERTQSSVAHWTDGRFLPGSFSL